MFLAVTLLKPKGIFIKTKVYDVMILKIKILFVIILVRIVVKETHAALIKSVHSVVKTST